MKLNSIKYEPGDLIQLIKNNTAAIVGCHPGELYVHLQFKNGKVSAEVVRVDQQEIEILQLQS